MFSKINISLITFIIFVGMIFGLVNGLKCRMENDIKTQEEFEEIVKNCMNSDSNESNNNNSNNRRKQNNNNNSRPWNNRGNDQRYSNTNSNHNNRGTYNTDDEGQHDDDRKDGSNRRGSNNGGKRRQPGRYNNERDSNERDYDYDNDRWYGQDNKRRQSGRGGNGGDSHSYGSNRRDQNGDNRYNNDPFNRHFNTSRVGTTSIGSPLEDVDACVIHCIFRQMKMVSDESYLNRNTVLNVLTRRIKDQELKAFILESVNECFENLDPDDEEMCDYSKSFAMCLEGKGKSNCDDWDLSAKFDRNNRNRNNNNNNGFSYQNSQSRG